MKSMWVLATVKSPEASGLGTLHDPIYLHNTALEPTCLRLQERHLPQGLKSHKRTQNSRPKQGRFLDFIWPV